VIGFSRVVIKPYWYARSQFFHWVMKSSGFAPVRVWDTRDHRAPAHTVICALVLDFA